MNNKPRRVRLSVVLKVSILAGSIAAIASSIVGFLIVNGSIDIVYQNALDRLKYETNIKSLRLVSDIKNLSEDSLYLVGTPPISGIPRAIVNDGVDPLDNSKLSTWQSRLTTIFTELIRAKPNYLQIRYIGIEDNAKELVRVERQGTVIRAIPENELQKKGDTTYVKNAFKINPGEIYLSDITLNRELGKISKPYTAMIRAATPVYFDDKLFGVLVINMSFNDIFDNLVMNTPREQTPYVTNESGYFLAHPDKTMTYGFDLGNNNKIQSIYTGFDLQKTKDSRDVELTVEYNGDVIHVVKSYFDSADKERFIAVMLATSYKNLLAKSTVLKYQSFTIIGPLVIISLIVAAMLGSRLMRPLRLISKASEDLANGREIQDLPIDSNDEIGELARSFDDMRHQLEDKERELFISQGRIHHANKMASLGEMAAGMAHEINSPIQTISLIAQRIQRQLKKNMSAEEIDDSMQKINGSVSKISEIIDSLKNVSRDSTDDAFHDIRVEDVIKDAINMTEERFKVNDVHFEVNYHVLSKNTLMQCQRLQISQVLINLINNAYDAIQAMDEKWIKIDIRKISDKIQISITDSGTGIPRTTVERMFEPMFTTKEVGMGTGLGLSISKEIISKHNGLMYVDKDAKNTRLVLELPIVHEI